MSVCRPSGSCLETPSGRDRSCLVAKGLLMISAGRQCSFWSSDDVLGNRPVPPPALPISPDIVPQRAGVTTVWFGSFDGLANQPNGPPVSGNAVFCPVAQFPSAL